MIQKWGFIILLCYILFFNPVISHAKDAEYHRFMFLKSSVINMRIGPGMDYPVVWIYRKQYIPVAVIDEYENWKKVVDITGAEGWIHKAMLGVKPHVMNDKKILGYKSSNLNSQVIAEIGPFVVSKLQKCNDDWCELYNANMYLWVKKEQLWGINKNE